jgi:hypothetical protein
MTVRYDTESQPSYMRPRPKHRVVTRRPNVHHEHIVSALLARVWPRGLINLVKGCFLARAHRIVPLPPLSTESLLPLLG